MSIASAEKEARPYSDFFERFWIAGPQDNTKPTLHQLYSHEVLIRRWPSTTSKSNDRIIFRFENIDSSEAEIFIISRFEGLHFNGTSKLIELPSRPLPSWHDRPPTRSESEAYHAARKTHNQDITQRFTNFIDSLNLI